MLLIRGMLDIHKVGSLYGLCVVIGVSDIVIFKYIYTINVHTYSKTFLNIMGPCIKILFIYLFLMLFLFYLL